MKHIKLLTTFFIILVIIGCSTAYKTITAEMPDLSTKNDGVYRGFYDLLSTPIKVTLNVVIENKKIVNIEILEHNCSPIGKKAEKIVDKIIEQQNLTVDVISGATASSISILKAVEDALR